MDLFAASPTQPPRAIKWPDESRCERLTFTVKKKAPAEGKDDKLGIFIPVCSKTEAPFKLPHVDEGTGGQNLNAKGLTACTKCVKRLPENIGKVFHELRQLQWQPRHHSEPAQIFR